MSVTAKAIADRQSEIERLQAEIKALNDVDKILGTSAPPAKPAARRSSSRRTAAAATPVVEIPRVLPPPAVEPGVEPGAPRSNARRVFGESEAAARRRAVGVGARESIFTTADVRSTCRRLRRPGPRSG